MKLNGKKKTLWAMNHRLVSPFFGSVGPSMTPETQEKTF